MSDFIAAFISPPLLSPADLADVIRQQEVNLNAPYMSMVRPTAREFQNQETADHSSQPITSSADVKMSNWTAAEIQDMPTSPQSL